MTDSVSERLPATTVRGFWWILLGGWAAYYGLFVSVAWIEGENAGAVLGLASVVCFPPALLSLLIARHRRHLLRPERALWRTVFLHVGVGIVFAFASGAVTVTAMTLWAPDWTPMTSGGTPVPAFAWGMNALFLYPVLAGFFMWTESLTRVQESRAIAEREATLRAQAEADAIKARFNPHFVFNTLHSLMLLVHAEPEVAERAIEDVASLIRYASILQRRGVDLVPLGQEVEVAQRYMALEKLRLGDRLTLEWDALDGLEMAAVPPLSLQILLENAVKHGIAPRTEGGTIRVLASSDGGMLHLTVEDDGEGADPETTEGTDRRGLGLLRARIETLFGSDASLVWTTAPGEGFRVTLAVPRTTASAVDVPGWEGRAVRLPPTAS